jgi:ubiquinone biosynthesis protein COQ9
VEGHFFEQKVAKISLIGDGLVLLPPAPLSKNFYADFFKSGCFLPNPLASRARGPTSEFMTDVEFDAALVRAAFSLAGEQGWRHVSPAAAARRAGLDLAATRQFYAGPAGILRAFGRLADAQALTGALTEGPVRERLFDLLMRRFDFLQTHRAGVLALLRALPAEPKLALCLARATLTSMGWMLEGAGVSAQGLRGEIRKKGLALVWGYGLRAWCRDDSADLTATMAEVDKALERAGAVAARFHPAGPPAAPDEPETPLPDEPAGVI